MDYLLFIVILLQFAYIIYQDFFNRKEREKLELKLMSKDVVEYKEAMEPPAKDTPQKRETYKATEDTPVDDLLKAEDNQ